MFRYVIVKVVRKDHLDHLPVPSRIKKYLNTPFYYSEQVMLIWGKYDVFFRVVSTNATQILENSWMMR